MSKTIAIRNPGPNTKYVGAILIEPGETKIFEPHQLPPGYEGYAPPGAAAKAAPETEPPKSPLQLFAEGKAADVIAGLPELADADLQALETLEEARGKKARSTVLAAIQTEQLARAELVEFAASLDGLTQGELSELLPDYAEGSAEHGILGERIEKLVAEAAKANADIDPAPNPAPDPAAE